MSNASIERSVRRMTNLAMLALAVAIVIVGGLVMTFVVVKRDDATATALARTMGSELNNHRGDTLSEKIARVAHELQEQRWFKRGIEVWIGDQELREEGTSGRLARFRNEPGCRFDRLGDDRVRLCTVRVENDTTVVVSSALRPLLAAQLPLLFAIALVAALATAVFTVLSRRFVRASLRPLANFEQRVSALTAGVGERVPDNWNAKEIDELAATFNATLARVDAVIERERQFAANAAHELRTPLTRLRGQIELVQQLTLEPEEAHTRLTLAVRTCEELTRSMETLLALARNKVNLSEAVDLAEIAMRVGDNLTDHEKTRVRVLENEALVCGDDTLLLLAATNLVENALKYSAGDVLIEAGVQGGRAFLQVLDVGQGISIADLSIVRQPFVRGEGSGNTRGTGLGLALVDHVASLHEGTLVLERRAPAGFRAALEIPLWH